MNEPNYKEINGTANTVGELVALLKQVPEHYSVSLSGLCSFGIVMDTANETTLIDDADFIDELLEE